MSTPRSFRAILSVRRTEFIWALVAFAGVVLVGTLKGILVAIIVSLFALAYQVADPPVYILGRKRGTNVFRAHSSENPDDEASQADEDRSALAGGLLSALQAVLLPAPALFYALRLALR